MFTASDAHGQDEAIVVAGKLGQEVKGGSCRLRWPSFGLANRDCPDSLPGPEP